MPTIRCAAAPGKGEEGAGSSWCCPDAPETRGRARPCGQRCNAARGAGAGSTHGSLPAWVGAAWLPWADAAPRPSLQSHRAALARVDAAAWPSPGLWMPPGMTRGGLPRFNISRSIASHFSSAARGHFPPLFRRLSGAGKVPSSTWPPGKHPPCSELCFLLPRFKALGPAPKPICSRPCCRQRREALFGAARHSPASVLRLGLPSLWLTVTAPAEPPTPPASSHPRRKPCQAVPALREGWRSTDFPRGGSRSEDLINAGMLRVRLCQQSAATRLGEHYFYLLGTSGSLVHGEPPVLSSPAQGEGLANNCRSKNITY